jgi:predicted O-methyltransferase YrrM
MIARAVRYRIRSCAHRLAAGLSTLPPDVRAWRDTLSWPVDDLPELAAIEALRGRLCASSTSIPDYHFGAGAPYSSGVTRIAEECRQSGMPLRRCRTIFQLVRRLQPSKSLELGTNLGISTAYLATGMKLNGSGRLISVEGSPALAKCATENLRALGLEKAEVVIGLFDEVLPTVLETLEQVDFAFIDGHHDEDATLRYFDLVKQKSARGAVLVFDDIQWSRGMQRAWKVIARDPQVSLALDLFAVGIVFLDRERRTGRRFFRVVV